MAAPSSSEAARSRSAPSCANSSGAATASCKVVPNGTKVSRRRRLLDTARWCFAACAALLAAACLLDPKSDDLPNPLGEDPNSENVSPPIATSQPGPGLGTTPLPTPTQAPSDQEPANNAGERPSDAGDAGSEYVADEVGDGGL